MSYAIREVSTSLSKFLAGDKHPVCLVLRGNYTKILSVFQREDTLVFLVVEHSWVGASYERELARWEALTDEQRKNTAKPSSPEVAFGVVRIGEDVEAQLRGQSIERFLGQIGDLVFVSLAPPFASLMSIGHTGY